MSPQIPERAAVVAALLSLLDSLHTPATVVVMTPRGALGTFQVPAPEGDSLESLDDRKQNPPRADTRCAEDILYVVGEAGEPLTTPKILAALQALGPDCLHGDDTVIKTLARLVKEGRLANPPDARPRGYRLPPLS